MTNDARGAFQDPFLHSVCRGWTGRLFCGSFSCVIYRENRELKIADLRISCTSILDIYRRRRRH